MRFKENDKEPLSEIRNRIEKAVENSDDFEICEAVVPQHLKLFEFGQKWEEEAEEIRDNNSGTVGNMKKEISNLKPVKKKLGLNEYTIDFEDLYGGVLHDYRYRGEEFYDKLRSGGITVYICPICAAMFSQASQAAYNVIYSGDDDD